MITNTHVTKVIKERINPILLGSGYSTIIGRKAWRYFNDKVYLVLIQGVGAYFSSVTGFPSISITASINIFYVDFPDRKTCKKISNGLPLPVETECHFRFSLDKIDPQSDYVVNIASSTERGRKDVWWIDFSGDNLNDAITDLSLALQKQAFPLVEKPCYQRPEQLKRFLTRS